VEPQDFCFVRLVGGKVENSEEPQDFCFVRLVGGKLDLHWNYMDQVRLGKGKQAVQGHVGWEEHFLVKYFLQLLASERLYQQLSYGQGHCLLLILEE
jgi:hypothetical protein